MKGKKDLAKLTKKTITDKNGITRTVWVKLDKDTKINKPKKKEEIKEKTAIKSKGTTNVISYKSISTKDLISLAKDNGVSWKESSDPRINRMRVIMKLKDKNITSTSEKKADLSVSSYKRISTDDLISVASALKVSWEYDGEPKIDRQNVIKAFQKAKISAEDVVAKAKEIFGKKFMFEDEKIAARRAAFSGENKSDKSDRKTPSKKIYPDVSSLKERNNPKDFITKEPKSFSSMKELEKFLSNKRFEGKPYGDPTLPENKDISLEAMEYWMKTEGLDPKKEGDIYLDDDDAGEEFDTFASDGILGVIRENLDDNETMSQKAFDKKYGKGMYDKILSDNPNDVMAALKSVKKVTKTDKNFKLGTRFLEGLIKIIDI